MAKLIGGEAIKLSDLLGWGKYEKWKFKRNVDECSYKIKQILNEYGCKIEYDDEDDLGLIILDVDTQEFTEYKYNDYKTDSFEA